MAKVPGYRRQKQKNRPDRAFVEIGGQRIYLGKYRTPESHREYARLIAEWEANGGSADKKYSGKPRPFSAFRVIW